VRWMEMVADRMEPIYNILKEGVLSVRWPPKIRPGVKL